MSHVTLEEVARRLADLEDKVAALAGTPRKKDWRRTVGMFEGSEFMAEVDAEALRARDAEREAARAGRFE